MSGGKHMDEAAIEWGAPGDGDAPFFLAPRSIGFDDVYFSGDGAAETRHIFLAGNGLPARFDAPRFSIGELGFGTGLNFLCAWAAWNKAEKPEGARLSFFSVEAFPLSAGDMARAHEAWPDFEPLAARMREQLPPPHPGFHHIAFGDVSLTLYYGDALAGLSQTQGGVDAWFLDGFSPAKNPAMWSEDIFKELARLSKRQASFATFTVAGGVRRALEAAGFDWEKRPGFGRKKQMLAGRITAPPDETKRAPWFTEGAPLKSGARIAVIGAGIAGASLAHALKAAGFNPSVYEALAPASGASGNPAGLVMPRLDVGDTPAGAFHALSYLHTVKLLKEVGGGIFEPCGVLLHAVGEKERARQEKLLAQGALPEGWMARREEGLFFPQGGVVDPPGFVAALLGDAPLIAERVRRLMQTENGWRVITDESREEFDGVVIANGLDALRFAEARTLPLGGSAGQVDWFPDAAPPANAHAFGPYAAPCPKFGERGGGAIIGATYAPAAIGAIGAKARFTKEATGSNIAAMARALPDFASTLAADASRPRASVRCTTPDRLPVCGPLPDWGFYGGAYDDLRTGKRKNYPPGELRPGLFVLTGLGSRGLVTAPYAAALLAAALSGAPVDSTILQALHPARFFIRDLKRAGAR
ncbi:bifunctional tRNA (5-methylaminomethyl-2-thiouridine)(34)-methyltransferase MnmD/FAD-dependent 5-carboxymethylaminomethyl-2-thiouridine(34) oxidoreductase MnmC [Hyphococcus luteus]|uniref:tRNA 5-methylaminomethyl-2-thiouridine biosynthesis bifunctional protein MnmC n=1 Tax=Hyphococcus luteus TaxID=2058213 RepID=A0A2S7K9I5_9PROT|nr:bifunctional tRNA (5-methylaminomethyl-2-thiouridine)(34)-methyltransferase MnmD/FAD-dependent 5-carboxymethylaminomethyl-2-thiouridine(34) oxidoreductase MnmC [Marinicaulis flavus]PQA89184.1 bifunctional tRNA (5-methylaminomethyl-2-thiouridine)(34)-methyltransferase MnmD/FAD-dependent 5-carboxymethylaminomethyl-2-thiouridine(34) oxidoreductase MnmC [Marinicaulis flavus]